MSDKKSFNLDNDEIDEVLTKLISGRTVIKSLAEKALSFYRQRKIDFRLYEEYYKSNGTDVKSQAQHYVMNTHGKWINHPDKEKENQDTTDTDNELKKLKLEVKRLKEENRRLCDKLEKTELSSEVNDREEGTEKLKDLSSDIKTIAVKNHEAKNRYREASCEPKVDPDAEDAKPSSTCSPENLAEKFRQLYEVEWKHAFDDLVQSVAEESLFVQLATVMKEIEKFCTEVGNQQTESIKKHVLEEMTYPKFRLENGDVMGGLHRAIVEEHQQEIVYKSVKELRNHIGTLSIGPLCQIFSNYQTQLLGSSEYLNLFAMKATELLWMMKIQLPPLELEWTYSGFTFDKTKFSVFRDSGNIVKQCIWPAVSRYSEGPLLAKGVILAK